MKAMFGINSEGKVIVPSTSPANQFDPVAIKKALDSGDLSGSTTWPEEPTITVTVDPIDSKESEGTIVRVMDFGEHNAVNIILNDSEYKDLVGVGGGIMKIAQMLAKITQGIQTAAQGAQNNPVVASIERIFNHLTTKHKAADGKDGGGLDNVSKFMEELANEVPGEWQYEQITEDHDPKLATNYVDFDLPAVFFTIEQEVFVYRNEELLKQTPRDTAIVIVGNELTTVKVPGKEPAPPITSEEPPPPIDDEEHPVVEPPVEEHPVVEEEHEEDQTTPVAPSVESIKQEATAEAPKDDESATIIQGDAPDILVSEKTSIENACKFLDNDDNLDKAINEYAASFGGTWERVNSINVTSAHAGHVLLGLSQKGTHVLLKADTMYRGKYMVICNEKGMSYIDAEKVK